MNAPGADAAELRHPLFARFFDRLSKLIEPELGPVRDRLTAGLSGRVLELGCGNGINFSHYPRTVTEVVAIEPEPYFRAKAERAAADAPVAVTVRAGLAGALELEPESFDAAVCCLVLCSIPAQIDALRELHGALRQGGELRFLEHVRADAPRKARLQSAADRSRLWPALAGGCHCACDTIASIRAAGYREVSIESLAVGPSWLLTNPHVLGAAVR